MMRVLLQIIFLSAVSGLTMGTSVEWQGDVHLTTPTIIDGVTLIGNTVTVSASEPVTLRGLITSSQPQVEGLTASVFSSSFRGLVADDWRTRTDCAGTRQDAVIQLANAAGTPAERKAWNISGSDTDWNQVSFQWDGYLSIPTDGIDIATTSDDGSRVWLDLNNNDLTEYSEWGSNGWGQGQGSTTRITHPLVNAGNYRVRVQWEEGAGGNSCQLIWRHSASEDWTLIPATAFIRATTLSLAGPITIDGPLSTNVQIQCHNGVTIGAPVTAGNITIHGQVDVTCDITDTKLSIVDTGELHLGGHTLRTAHLSGTGALFLEHGSVYLSSHTVQMHGPGALYPQVEPYHCATLDDAISVNGDHYVVQEPHRVRARIVMDNTLSTVIPLGLAPSNSFVVHLRLHAAAHTPTFGVGVARCDRHGRWFQQLAKHQLSAGTSELSLSVGANDALIPEGHDSRWLPLHAHLNHKVMLVLYGDQPATRTIDITATMTAQPPSPPAAFSGLTDFQADGMANGQPHAQCGQRWEMRMRPLPFPENPYDPASGALDAIITEPDGSTRSIAGFYAEPQERIDRGDAERFRTSGSGHFAVRFRPRIPGPHQLQLCWTDATGVAHRTTLPDMIVEGPADDPIIRPDAVDSRFFSANGTWVWPLGHNLHSTYDVRALQAVQSQSTPDRGMFTHEARLRRLAAAGGTGCETWLSAWNLGLEWNSEWDGYFDAGAYNQGHAEAFDHFLNVAEELGIAVNVSIFNHGMARDGAGAEHEWPDHPWNSKNGGWINKPVELFTDDRTFAAQQRLFRYLTARYADSPALLGWKLWAEVNLANAPSSTIAEWHTRASKALVAMDPYHRAVTTHWCGDWRNADAAICSLPSIGYITIDAYHGENSAIHALLGQSIRDPTTYSQGVGRYNKPVWVTEFGGDAFGCSPDRLDAEHRIGPWAALVTGHAASPLLWWLEWIDQNDAYQVYHAVSAFLAGEDIRDPSGNTRVLNVGTPEQAWWGRVWRTNATWLGYIVDDSWGRSGGAGTLFADVPLQITGVPGGTVSIEWWDADQGQIRAITTIQHPGGVLRTTVPSIQCHIAFKLRTTAAGN